MQVHGCVSPLSHAHVASHDPCREGDAKNHRCEVVYVLPSLRSLISQSSFDDDHEDTLLELLVRLEGKLASLDSPRQRGLGCDVFSYHHDEEGVAMNRAQKKLNKAFGGKTFVITGAAAGLGASTARLLSDYWGGALLLDVNEVGLASVTNELAAHSPNVISRAVDLLSAESIDDALSDLPPEFDPPDYLVNNAGISVMKLAEKQPLDEYRKMMEVNYFAVIQLINRFLPKMLERRAGHLLTIASGSGVLANYGGAGYCASKFATVGYMEVLRQELAGTGVKTHCVWLPAVMTDLHLRILEGEFADRAETLPTVTPDEAAERLLDGVAANREVITFGGSVEAGLLMNRISPGLLRKAMSINGYLLNRRRGRV